MLWNHDRDKSLCDITAWYIKATHFVHLGHPDSGLRGDGWMTRCTCHAIPEAFHPDRWTTRDANEYLVHGVINE
jgi:hypothetical protein